MLCHCTSTSPMLGTGGCQLARFVNGCGHRTALTRRRLAANVGILSSGLNVHTGRVHVPSFLLSLGNRTSRGGNRILTNSLG